ncbi:hypothetical protein [Sphingomonas sp.]|uniref:hypothetical protein n=1 Tax=Sphingomonas sp. TaxID=28214 RepID=UPI00356387C8
MEGLIGRRLSADEHVHHIDGNGLNNAVINLELISIQNHARLHRKPLGWDFDKAKQLRNAGATYQEIADSLGGGLHWSAIWSAFKTRGLLTKRTKFGGRNPTYDIDRAIALYAGGATISAIASALGGAPANITSALKRRGVQIRDRIQWDTDKALTLRSEGHSYRIIAEKLGISEKRVNYFFQKRINVSA